MDARGGDWINTLTQRFSSCKVKPSHSAGIANPIDYILSNPSKPLPPQVIRSSQITENQLARLMVLFKASPSVLPSQEPVQRGRSSMYRGFYGICLGEQGKEGCHRSITHEASSYGHVDSQYKFITTRGWMLFRPALKQ